MDYKKKDKKEQKSESSKELTKHSHPVYSDLLTDIGGFLQSGSRSLNRISTASAGIVPQCLLEGRIRSGPTRGPLNCKKKKLENNDNKVEKRIKKST